MAENLNFKIGNSWCYDNNNSYCNKYGRLYDWNTAMRACPAGWRLPNRADWNDLVKVAGGKNAGRNLKSSTSGWNIGGNGNDMYGFSALPGGSWYNGFYNAGHWGNWWSATEWWSAGSNAWYRSMSSNYTGVDELNNLKINGFSVRCFQDVQDATHTAPARSKTPIKSWDDLNTGDFGNPDW